LKKKITPKLGKTLRLGLSEKNETQQKIKVKKKAQKLYISLFNHLSLDISTTKLQ